MISINKALKIVDNQKVKLAKTKVSLSDSLNFYLAESIISPLNLPSFNNSAMDGFAVCGFSDSYSIMGEVPAGSAKKYSLANGEAMRIFTGGKVPDNTTAVVMQEKADVKGTTVYIDDTVSEGKNIRLQGRELEKGQEVFKTGHRITPASMGLIGSLGINSVKVFQKPSIRIITTGNELVAPGGIRKEGQIYESNSIAVTGVLEDCGFKCQEKKQICDDLQDIKAGIADFLTKSDVLILSGGISVGDYDFVRQALVENGVKKLFYKVLQKPGKPLYCGRKGDTFVFALPGNPASALTCFYIHVLPLLQKISGATETGLQRIPIPINHDYEYRSDRPIFLKAKIEGQNVSILNRQSSSMIHSMAVGDALVFLDEPGSIQKGDLVECILI